MEETISDEIVVRFSNAEREPNNIVFGVNRKYCVGDYSCCGHVP